MSKPITEYSTRELAKIILEKNLIYEKRVGGMYQWEGFLISCGFDEKDMVKKTIIEALELLSKESEKQ